MRNVIIPTSTGASESIVKSASTIRRQNERHGTARSNTERFTCRPRC